MSGKIADQICGHLSTEVVTRRTKRSRRRSRGTDDLLYIDRVVIRDVMSRENNLAMAWIDYKKARKDRVDGVEPTKVLKKAKKDKRLQDWEKKALHGQYLRQTKKVRSEQNWVCYQNGDLKRETESVIVAAKNQSIRKT